MDEIHKYQQSVEVALKEENEKFREIERTHDIDSTIAEGRLYIEKLANIKRDMLIMKDRTIRLKRRAAKILDNKNRENIERQRSRERREMLEKHLEPVVNTKRD